MNMARHRARFDWMIELGGASAFALGCAYAMLKLAPSFAWPPQTATMLAAIIFFAIGMLVLRAAPGGPVHHRLAEFAVGPVESEELLLDTPIEPEELLLETPWKSAEDVLLLEDALPEPDPASRVVQLFASAPMPTPGQLSERIDRHLAGESAHSADGPSAPNHASEALYAALDELRRSLR